MLFTGSGRHRRQSQAEKAAERAIAVAGVAGVGFALPLLAVTSAQAAPSTVWDRVADCESGGNWTSDAGTGLYGGLQINAQRWTDYGGTQFAALPSDATRSQQIAVAERILATEGPSPWSACADGAGLNTASAPGVVDDNDSADETGSLRGARGIAAVNAAADGSTVPDGNAAPVFSGLPGYDPVSHVYWYEKNGAWFWTSHQSLYERYIQLTHPQPTAPDATATTAPDATATPSVPPVTVPGIPLPTDPTTTPSPTTPADGNNGNGNGNGNGHNGAGNGNGNSDGNNGIGNGGLLPTLPITPSPDASGTPAATTPDASATGSATPAPSTSGSPTATPAAVPAQPAAPATPATPATPAAPAAEQPYTVGPGDTLASIARSHELDGGWSALYQSNQQVVGGNPDLIHPGQVLHLG